MARTRGRLDQAFVVAGPASLVVIALIASRDLAVGLATALVLTWILALDLRSGRALKAADRRQRRREHSLEEQFDRSRRKSEELDRRLGDLREEVSLLLRRFQVADIGSAELLASVRLATERLDELEAAVGALQDSGQAQVEGLRGDVALLSGRVDEVFHQAESLAALYRLLEPSGSLPPTRGWSMSPDLLRHLAMHVLEQRPRTIVECGSGTSTAVMALALKRSGTGGRVIALEHLDWARDATVRLLEQWGVVDHAEVRLATLETYELAGDAFQWYARSTLPEGPFDLVVVDGPPGSINPLSRYPAGEMLIRHLAPTGRALLDDHGRPDERKAARRWLSEIEGLTSRKVRAEKGALELFWDTAT